MTQVTCLCCRIVFVCEWVCLWVYVWAAETGVLYNLWDVFIVCAFILDFTHIQVNFTFLENWNLSSVSLLISCFSLISDYRTVLMLTSRYEIKNTAFRIRQPAKLGNYFWWLSNSFHYKDLTSQVRPWETFGKKFWYHILR